MTKEEKQRVHDVLAEMLPKQWCDVLSIEDRLCVYLEGLVNSPEEHNAYELLGAVKFLRLLRTYEVDREAFRDVVMKYEGEWEEKNGAWHHVDGGLKHPGNTGPTYYRLQPFQVFVLASMFAMRAWVSTEVRVGTRPLLPTEREGEDGYIYDLRRLCTEFTFYTPRKTAKTQLSAFIQFWFFMSGDENAECYCCANASSQSAILFNRSKDLIRQMDPHERRIRFTASQVNWKPGQFRSASLTALSAGGKTKDGLFAQLCSADEFGSAAYVNGASDMGKLVSVVESSMGPRREPMTFISTTAGIIREGPFIDKLRGMKRLLEAELDPNAAHELSTDRQACLLLEPDEWEQQDEEVLLTSKLVRRKVNPMLGIIVQHSFYDDEIAKARQNPEKKNEVVSKLFNVYQTGRVQEWVKPEEVRAIQVERRIDDCTAAEGWLTFTGMDFSKGDDLNGCAFLSYNPNTGEFFGDMDVYVSEEAVNQSPIRELWQRWASEGWVTIVPGKTFDPSWPVNRIMQLHQRGVDFITFGYDPYNAKTVVNAMTQWVFDMGADPKQVVVPVRQNFATYSPAVKEFDYMVKRSRDDGAGHRIADPLVHLSKNPLWPYCFGCVMLQESNDGMGNLKPVKRDNGAATKVDPVQMLLSALILYDAAESQIN